MNQNEIEFFKKQNLTLDSVIAQGGYGVIYNVYSSQYNTNFALKRIPSNCFYPAELDCLKQIDDPHIVNLYQFYQFEGNVYMLMEYCNTDLDKVMKQKKDRTKDELVGYVHDVIRAVKACHDRKIAHCDIKPSNFLVDKYGRIKIGDFGLSTLNCDGNLTLDFLKGTRLFMAPEMFTDKTYNPLKADIWALGVTIYFMATQKYPFYSTDKQQLTMLIIRGLYNDGMIKDIHLRKLIRCCLDPNPKTRATCDELLQCSYFTEDQEENIPLSLSESFLKSSQLIIKPKVNNKKVEIQRNIPMAYSCLRYSKIHLVIPQSKSQLSLQPLVEQ